MKTFSNVVFDEERQVLGEHGSDKKMPSVVGQVGLLH